jgi:acetyl-CoA carboxylase biotin carboxylase subunit
MRIRKLLVANRGEIAVRIIRAARDLGISTVQVHSAADSEMLAVKLADEAVEIGPPPAAKSYLDGEAIIGAAKSTGADAIHPGYGFLAENADFAARVDEAGLIWVGPDAETIRKMGDKAAARAEAQRAGIPVVPGSEGVHADPAEALAVAERVGFPVMIKAAAGGGGKGIRIARNAEELARLAPQAATEAKAAFGDGSIYLERLITEARHIEVQVLGDGENAIHCWERECSLQRRRQKLWEEAPSIALDAETRRRIGEAAATLARSVGYRTAGTVEFLYDGATGEFFFIEMNTRIQVEHPVTEMITGVDLVAEMIRIARGGRLRHRQEEIPLFGHAIEVRLNAEDPAMNFMPHPGRVESMHLPGGPGVRLDHMLYPGYQVPPFYDSLLGKLIVHGEDRQQALRRLDRALRELRVEGLPTTAPLFRALIDCDEVRCNAVHTAWLEGWLEASADQITDAEASQKGGKTA